MLHIKWVFIFLSVFIFLPSLVRAEELPPTSLLIVTFQDPPVLSSKEEIAKLVHFAKKARMDTLFMQIYRANQSWFPSTVADQTPYNACLKKVGEDPFALLIKESHKKGIKVFAWLNILSLSTNENAPILKKYGPDILTRNTKEKKDLSDYKIDNQYFLEPGDPRVKDDLLTLVDEITNRYPKLDGILFDYIRYPDVNPAYGYTPVNIERFKKATGSQALGEKSSIWKKWKRDQVTGLLKALAKRTRRIEPAIRIAATGCVSYIRAYEESFQDWPSWINQGIVDFVALMNYPEDVAEFKRYIKEAKEKVDDFKKVHVAVGAYKFVKTPSVFKKQFSFAQQSGAGGCIVFHYESLLENPALNRVFFHNINDEQ